MENKSNFQRAREAILAWPKARLRESAAIVEPEFRPVTEAIRLAAEAVAAGGDGYRLLYLYDTLDDWAKAIRAAIDRAPKLTATTIEKVEIDRPGEETLRARKRVTKEI